MAKRQLTRRDFLGTTAAGVAASVVVSGGTVAGLSSCSDDKKRSGPKDALPEQDFTAGVKQTLPREALYDYHHRLATEPVHKPERDPDARPGNDEMTLPDNGWKLMTAQGNSVILNHAVLDFQDYLKVSQNVEVDLEEEKSLANWQSLKRGIIVGTRKQIPGCGATLRRKKSYEIRVTRERIVVCGYDERGAMFGLYHLESRMNLREGPFLPANLKTVRESLYDTRMALSWLGWMEWPDRLLSHLVHDGFDAIFASVYANPNGDRTTADTSTDFYARILYRMRHQDPARVRDLINRASQFGIKVYTPIIYQYMGTPESEKGLRRLVRDIISEFPDIRGYILLTEGFWYKAWGGGHGKSKAYLREWARNWSRAVGIVEEECHRVDPEIEIIPWEYNIDFRPQNADIKRYFIKQLPQNTIPMLTWENGKSFELDGMKGYLRDYSLNQVGPAEVTDAQIDEADKRGMKIYSKVDTFASWQYGTIPYLPCPYQWYKRYQALEKYGVRGTLESWSNGYKPNFISKIRAWTCWTDAPSEDGMLSAVAARIFGKDQVETVKKAWMYFSEAIRLVPDTGPNMGTNNAIGNPLFFKEPPARTATFMHSWSDQNKRLSVNPFWPFTVSRMVFYPDFTNQTDRAERYARRATGLTDMPEDKKVLPVFLKYLKRASDRMEKGLELYRAAAEKAPAGRRTEAFREVVVAEQLQRMMQSDHAILRFEELRLRWVKEPSDNLLKQMEDLVREEIDRTELSLLAASRDSRLGYEFEQDYVYTPYSLKEKLNVLKETLEVHLPEARGSSTSKQ